MDDRQFNTTMYGYLVYTMVQADFSRRDIDRMIRLIEHWGCDDMTLQQAEQYMKKIWNGEKNIDYVDNRPDRILDKEEAGTRLK